jgi:hypothetical protein
MKSNKRSLMALFLLLPCTLCHRSTWSETEFDADALIIIK